MTEVEASDLSQNVAEPVGVRELEALLSLETMAIVAYRQPVTRGLIERIRGVDSDYVVRSLLHRRLIAEQGRAETPGRPILYGTTFEFMERFGLTSLDDLPALDTDTASGLQAAVDSEIPAADVDPEPEARPEAQSERAVV